MRERFGKLMRLLSRHRVLTRVVSMILVLTLLFYVIPSVVYAEVADAIAGIGEGSATNESGGGRMPYATSYEGIDYEVTELREEGVKHFHLADGSYIAAQYAYPVHYEKDGRLVDIDNSLSEAWGMYSTPDARIKLSKKTTGNSVLFTLHDGSTKLTMALVGAVKGVVGVATNGEDGEELTELGKLMHLERLSSSVLYRDILDGTDLEYILHPEGIKENIIVKERRDSYNYAFSLILNGLTPALASDGSISLVEEKEGKVKYVIPAPVVYDSAGAYAPSGTASYSLIDNGNGKYTLAVVASASWINDEDRAFPVTIDPAIGNSGRYLRDTMICSSSQSSIYGGNAELYVSSRYTTYWRMTSLPTIPTGAYVAKAELAYRTAGELSTDFKVGAYQVSTDWDFFTFNYASYNGGAGARGALLDAQVVPKEDKQYVKWDITAAYREWEKDNEDITTNYGIALVSLANAGTAAFHSYESTELQCDPQISIHYTYSRGREPYYATTSHSVGIAGSGSINLAGGSLNFAIPTLTTTDALFSYTPTLYYDSFSAGEAKRSYLPRGFYISVSEYIYEHAILGPDGVNDFVNTLNDGDGTPHTFYVVPDPKLEQPVITYADEDGLGLNMYQNDDGDYVLTDINSKLVRIYTNTGSYYYLTRIEDRVGNALRISLDDSNKPTGISIDPAGDTAPISMLEFRYTTDGMLSMVYNPTSKDAVVFRYITMTDNSSIIPSQGKYLSEINYAHGNSNVTDANWSSFILSSENKTNITLDASAYYEYDSAGRMISAKDGLANHRLDYTLDDSGKITAITEYAGATSTEGQSIALEYNLGYTDLISSGNDEQLNTADDITTRYIFDNYGRASSVYSFGNDGKEIYGATMGEYQTQENVKNSLKQQTTIGGVSTNLLLNGDFEDNTSSTFTYWTISGNVKRYSDVTKYGKYSASLTPSATTPASISQAVSLGAGNYVLSMDIESYAAADISAVLSVTSISGASVNVSKEIPLAEVGIVGSPYPIALTLTLSASAVVKITLETTLVSSSGNYFELLADNVMLEAGITPSRFSLIEYGSFTATGRSIDGASTVALGTKWSGTYTTYTENSLFGESLRLSSASALGTAYAKQRVFEESASFLANYTPGSSSQSFGGSFILSAFAKASGAIPGGVFRIRVEIGYYQGEDANGNRLPDEVVTYTYDYIPNHEAWQFGSLTFSTNYTPTDAEDTASYDIVTYIDVYCEYSLQNSGTLAYFDNVSLTPTLGNAYTYLYNEQGQLAIKEQAYFREYYVYSEDRDLIWSANSDGDAVSYTYDNLNLPLDEVVYSLNNILPYIDNPAEVTFGRISSLSKTPKFKTEYTYDTYGQAVSTVSMMVDENYQQLSGTPKVVTASTYNTTAGSKIFGTPATTTDADGIVTKYFYDSANGRLMATVNTINGNGLAYTYDGMGRMTGVTPAVASMDTYISIQNAESVYYAYNTNGRLAVIATDTTTYSLTYDVFGNSKTISAGSNNLASYEYNEKNGKLAKITYGNGYSEIYTYDRLENLIKVCYTNGESDEAHDLYEYEYDANGCVILFKNHHTGIGIQYSYDSTSRLIGYMEYDLDTGFSDIGSSILYDAQSRVSSQSYYLEYMLESGSNISANGKTIRYNYTYDDDGSLYTANYDAGSAARIRAYYIYDAFGRVTGISYTGSISGNSVSGSISNSESYTYPSSGSKTSSRVSTYTTTVGNSSTTYGYTYDPQGNISQVIVTGAQSYSIDYHYDDLGQLTREDNSLLNKTYTYTYDDAGNILEKRTYAYTTVATVSGSYVTASYAYGNTSWGDKLTAYNGNTISYDNVGNPLTYYNGAAFSWLGRQMVGATINGTSYTFTYNDEGIRNSKTTGGVTTNYYYEGTRLIAEETPTALTVYIYDASGKPMGMMYRSSTYASDKWDVYTFETNLQGDVVAVYSANGTKLITYAYDAWGAFTVSYHNGGSSTTATENKLLYRGYYFDSSIDLYYLSSRYYDSAIGRFISPDDAGYLGANGDINSYNLYAYCSNNPVMYSDPSGNFIITTTMLIGGLIGAVVGAASAALSGEDGWGIAIGAVSGFAGGALTASGVGAVGQVVGSALIAMASNAATQTKNIISDETGETTFNVADMLIDGALAAVAARISGNGATYKNEAGIESSWKRLFKKGLSDSNARQYFAKTAHSEGGKFVLKSLTIGLTCSTAASIVIIGKSHIREAMGW